MQLKLKLLTKLLFLNSILFHSTITLAQSGSLDITFDNDGKLTTSFGGFNSIGRSVVIQTDGKIVVAGFASNGNNYDFALSRYHPEGGLDSTFSFDGKVTTSIGSNDDIANSVVIQSDGKIVVAGSSSNNFALVRYNNDGTLDSSFNSNGIVTTIFSSFSKATSLAIQSDGKIVIFGETSVGPALARYNSLGDLDSSFGINGKVISNLSNFSAGNILIQPDGKILTAGSITSIGSFVSFSIARYNQNGSIDGSFGFSGANSGGIDSWGGVIALQQDGKIVMGGYLDNGTVDFALSRFNMNGSNDNSFGVNGTVLTSFGVYGICNSIVIQPDGKIIAAGQSHNGTNYLFTLARYNTDGSLDNSFDLDGKVITNFGGSNSRISSISLQSDGKIVAAGHISNIGNSDYALARYNNNNGITFPIELLSFDAQCLNGSVNLNWIVATQLNSKCYTIERSADGINFEIVGTVNTTSNSSQNQNYYFNDINHLGPSSYYRLKQTDLDGQFQYFKTIQVFCDNSSDLRIYPNPSLGLFKIEGVMRNSDIVIKDVTGQIVFQSKKFKVNSEINLSNQANGIYFLEIYANDIMSTYKIMINK